MLENFIYAKKKSLFEKKLTDGAVLDEAIVFIEDSKEIWNHGTYFDGKSNPVNISELTNDVNYATISQVNEKQDTLVSGTNIKTINGESLLGGGDIIITSGVSNEDFQETLATKQDIISDLNDIRSGAALGTTAIQPSSLSKVATSGSYNDLTNKPVIPTETTESTVSGWGFTKNTGTYSKPSNGIPKTDLNSSVQLSLEKADTALQSIPSEYITESELNAKNYATITNVNNEITTINNIIGTNSTDQTLSERIDYLETKCAGPDAKSNVLWIGTSIPAGDITFSNNGTTQSITSNLGSNNYPKMIADELGFNLYNNSRGASFVCFYPSSEDGTSNWAGKDWTEYQNEVHKGYSLSASMAQVEAKFGPNGLNIPEWLLNNFKSYSYESLIIPYIDGTLASCDTVILDHGYNDRHQILSETSWHISEGEEMVIGSGRDWLLKLQDPFEKTLTSESFFQGCWWSDENAEDTKKYYWKAMVFLCKKIWAVNPRIKIIIGNYFTTKSNIFGGEYGNDRLGEFICLANSGLANWLRCQCVDVHKYTGIYNRNLAAGNDYQIFCPDNVHPHSDSTGRSNRIIAGIYINALRGILYK